ncbi:hypothetical protein SAMN05444161_8024 [Rhizobiales bacterium GAS191]|nr:hypothetical protein SAMN05444161_8024 [Rhizobiales bacterium GAS191]
MELQQVSGGLHLDRTDPHGRAASIPSSLSTGSLPLFLVQTGGNSAGNGGGSHFLGAVVHAAAATYSPVDVAVGGPHATADAHQTNAVHFDQGATQIAGVGGPGGTGNAAIGGNVSVLGPGHASDHGWIGSDVIATGGSGAGNGGDGHFLGAMINASTAIFHPINIAVGGPHASADAHQTNAVHFDQGATQIAGVGGHGGNGNAAIGGDVSISGPSQGSGHGWIGSDVIATGGNHAGNGGDGSFFGSIAHVSFALYEPINIAVAGPNSSAHADQTNTVDFNQSALQMAGVGGHGGDSNVAAGGSGTIHSSSSGLIGSDVIATGFNSAGDGGNGHFSGSLTDVSVAIYAPINIAVAGYNSTASADQINNVHFDQSAIQIAGVGGHGGDGNLAQGGDFALHLLADHHLLHVG